MNIVGPLAGTRHMLGTTDNGFPWSNKWGKLTDAQLATYYTPALLAATDFLGGDFYDGATNSNVGEPAAVKLANFEAWAARVAPGKPLGVGEWNAVTATDIHAGWTVLRQGGWVIACIFNSGANNRDDLPSSLGGSWVLRGDRLAAFRSVLDQAASPRPLTNLHPLIEERHLMLPATDNLTAYRGDTVRERRHFVIPATDPVEYYDPTGSTPAAQVSTRPRADILYTFDCELIV